MPGKHCKHRATTTSTRRLSRLAVPVALGAVAATSTLGAPAASAQEGGGDAPTRAERAAYATEVGKDQIGDPYEYGAAGPHRFDCSGLLQYSYRKAGFEDFPRTSDAQAQFTRRIDKDDLQRGDMMFFHEGGDVYHAAMFLAWHDGRRVMLDVSGDGDTVEKAVPWTGSWYAGTLRGM